MAPVFHLFEDFVRNDQTPARYSESQFDFLNRSAWQNVGLIRDVLEDWFPRYPADHAASLRSRFCSPKDHEHQSAFFELLLHQVLVELGCSVEVEPETPTPTTGRPDYLATLNSGAAFYLEAKVVRLHLGFDYTPIEKIVLDEINKLRCPDFWLTADFEGVLVSTPPLRNMRSELQKWVDGLVYRHPGAGDVTKHSAVTCRYPHDGWTLVLGAFPRGQAARGKVGTRPLGMPPGTVGRVDSASPIRKAVTKKANRYGKLDAPLVVALNLADPSVDRMDIIDALFGQEQWTYEFGQTGQPTAPSFSRKRNGAWVNASGARNTRVSGVLVFQNVSPWNLVSTSICLYENPWAAKPLSEELTCFPRAALEGEQVEWINGKSLGSVLGLPEDWPGPK